VGGGKRLHILGRTFPFRYIIKLLSPAFPAARLRALKCSLLVKGRNTSLPLRGET